MEEKHDRESATRKPALDSREKEIVELVRMARQRDDVPCPDPNDEWARIAERLNDSPSDNPVPPTDRPSVNSRLKLLVAAALGAAAMLAAVVCYNHFTAHTDTDGLVALNYVDTPRQVMLSGGGHTISLAGRDSVSFLAARPSRSGAKDNRLPATNEMQQLSTPRGMDFKITLSDGSEVWLNAESRIKFPAAFSSTGERRVELQGEAYFRIAHDARHPFVVSAGDMDVRVLGTEFNLRNYRQETTRVSLVKGSLAVLDPESRAEACRLVPGQQAWRDDHGKVHVGQADTYGDTQWVDGFFYFDDAPLVSILRELGRWYNLGVVFRRNDVAGLRLHFSASRKDGIGEALSTLNGMLKVKIEQEGTDIVVR